MTNLEEEEYLRYSKSLIEFARDKRVGFDGYKKMANQNMKLFEFEEKILNFFDDNQFSLIKKSRQMHLTTLASVYCAWCMIFKHDYSIGIVSTNINMSNNIINRVREILQNFNGPIFNWDEYKVKDSKGEIRLMNGCSIKSFTPKNAGIGYQINMFILDECAYYSLEDIFKRVIPVMFALKNSKIIAYSTPNGFNDFHKLWDQAISIDGRFKGLNVNWRENPNYNEEWYNEKCKLLGWDKELIRSELEGGFIKKKKKNKKPISIRLNDDILDKVYKKIEKKGITISKYIKDLVKRDLGEL